MPNFVVPSQLSRFRIRTYRTFGMSSLTGKRKSNPATAVSKSSCAALILFSPLWGTAACLSGLAVTLLSGWLPLGAVVIPALFVPPAFLCHGREAGLLALILALIMLSRHIRGLGRILRGEEERKFRGR